MEIDPSVCQSRVSSRDAVRFHSISPHPELQMEIHLCHSSSFYPPLESLFDELSSTSHRLTIATDPSRIPDLSDFLSGQQDPQILA
jgi:hypothetical protein